MAGRRPRSTIHRDLPEPARRAERVVGLDGKSYPASRDDDTRADALNLLADGFSVARVAAWYGVSERTVRRWRQCS
jgi:hypothetical protein